MDLEVETRLCLRNLEGVWGLILKFESLSLGLKKIYPDSSRFLWRVKNHCYMGMLNRAKINFLPLLHA